MRVRWGGEVCRGGGWGSGDEGCVHFGAMSVLFVFGV